MITFVFCQARGGSSLICQMLKAGGMDVPGDWPSFEQGWVTEKPQPQRWDEYDGKVLKVLQPHIYLPPHIRGRGILIERDAKQQAKSFVKVQREVQGLAVNRKHVGVQSKMLRRSQSDMIRACLIGSDGLLRIRFEDAVEAPDAVAVRIAIHLADIHPKLDINAMAGAVVRRHPDCLKGLLERALLQAGPKPKGKISEARVR